MKQYLKRMVLILYQPQDVVNVAAVIRVMSNFGLSHLRLVEPAAFDPYRIEGIAHHTERLVAATRRFPTLEEAVADCGFILGTTGRPRWAERLVLEPREAAPLLLQRAAEAPGDQKVAILFGREKDGLPNEALDRCHGVITIPTHPENPSLNLAQAALVVAYECWMAASAPAGAVPADPPTIPRYPSTQLASGKEREAMFAAFQAMLTALYPTTTESRLKASVSRFRNLLMRAAPRTEEAAAMTNLFRHAARALGRAVSDPTDHPGR